MERKRGAGVEPPECCRYLVAHPGRPQEAAEFRKLDGRKGGGATERLVEDDGIRADDITGGRAWVCP